MFTVFGAVEDRCVRRQVIGRRNHGQITQKQKCYVQYYKSYIKNDIIDILKNDKIINKIEI